MENRFFYAASWFFILYIHAKFGNDKCGWAATFWLKLIKLLQSTKSRNYEIGKENFKVKSRRWRMRKFDETFIPKQSLDILRGTKRIRAWQPTRNQTSKVRIWQRNPGFKIWFGPTWSQFWEFFDHSLKTRDNDWKKGITWFLTNFEQRFSSINLSYAL